MRAPCCGSSAGQPPFARVPLSLAQPPLREMSGVLAETVPQKQGGTGAPQDELEEGSGGVANAPLSETVLLYAVVHPSAVAHVLEDGVLDPVNTPLDDSFRPCGARPQLGAAEPFGFLCETPEDAVFLGMKSAARKLGFSLSDGIAPAVDLKTATGVPWGGSFVEVQRRFPGSRAVTCKFAVPLRAWYVWQRESAQYFKTPFPHFQFQRPFHFADMGATVDALSATIKSVLDPSPATSLANNVRLWIPLRAEDSGSVAGHFELREDGWARGDDWALAKSLLSARDMSRFLLVPGLLDLQPASLAFRDPTLALLTMDSLERSLAAADEPSSSGKRRRKCLKPLTAVQDPMRAMLASEPMKERPLLEVAMDEAAFVQLSLEGHAVVITWPPCPHVRLGRRLWSAAAMVVVRMGSVRLSCHPCEGSNDDDHE